MGNNTKISKSEAVRITDINLRDKAKEAIYEIIDERTENIPFIRGFLRRHYKSLTDENIEKLYEGFKKDLPEQMTVAELELKIRAVENALKTKDPKVLGLKPKDVEELQNLSDADVKRVTDKIDGEIGSDDLMKAGVKVGQNLKAKPVDTRHLDLGEILIAEGSEIKSPLATGSSKIAKAFQLS